MEPMSGEKDKTSDSMQVYGQIAIIFLNVVILFLVCNVLAWAAIKVKHSFFPNLLAPLKDKQKVYPGWTLGDIVQLQDELQVKASQYAPWVGFREKARSGKYVNVSQEGFRYSFNKNALLKDEGINIFVFGGSSTFGYGVEDTSTIPAHMQKLFEEKYPGKKINVFNFGAGAYFSRQEFEWLATLLREGHVPEIAIFIDGYNEWWGTPAYTHELTGLFEAKNNDPLLFAKQIILELPLIDFLRRALNMKTSALWNPMLSRLSPHEITARYSLNKKLTTILASEYGVRTYFFIQPVTGYRSKFHTHLFDPDGTSEKNTHNIEMIALLAGTADMKTSFDITGLLADYEKQPFVDGAHYTPEVCGMVARAIVERVVVP